LNDTTHLHHSPPLHSELFLKPSAFLPNAWAHQPLEKSLPLGWGGRGPPLPNPER
jgi:hypothetical protein